MEVNGGNIYLFIFIKEVYYLGSTIVLIISSLLP